MTSTNGDTIDDSGIERAALMQATQTVIEAVQRRLAKEIVAAWRADYPALDVVIDPMWPVDQDRADDLGELLTMRAAYVPSYKTDPPDPACWPAEVNVQRYRIDDLTRAEAKRMKRRWMAQRDADADADD